MDAAMDTTSTSFAVEAGYVLRMFPSAVRGKAMRNTLKMRKLVIEELK
jgi:hypothetical protein